MKKFLALALAVTMSLSLLAGCSSDSGSDTVIIAATSDPVSMDPQISRDIPSMIVYTQMYEKLFVMDDTLTPTPWLAESYEFSDDSLSLTIKLKEGITFHNGEELKANDVAFTILRAKTEAAVSSLVDPVSDVVVIDDYTVEVQMSQVFVPILTYLAQDSLSIMCESAWDEYGYDIADNPIGTGPYEFVSITLGDSVQLKRYEDYWGEPAVTENAMIRTIPESASRLLEVESGGVNVAYDIAPSDVPTAESSDEMFLVRDLNLSTAYMGFNCDDEILGDVKVRQAINYALDLESVVTAVYTGAGAVSNAPMGDIVWGVNENLTPYDQDLDKAKELLAEAGYPDGFEVNLWTNDNSQRIQIAEIVQNQLAAVGIDVTVSILEWSTYLSETSAGNHQMYILGWTCSGDADSALYDLNHSSQQGEGSNRSFWENDYVDAQLDYARTVVDDQERYDIYQEIQEIIWDECPAVYLWQGEYISGVHEGTEGFENMYNGAHAIYTLSAGNN